MTGNKSIVFAHGIWADGSCFSKLIPPLRAEGYEVLCSQHGLDDAQADVDCTVRNIARATRPVVLVGHSYGGAVITAAGTDDRVVGLVYISALGPDDDETAASEQAKFPKTAAFGNIEVADGRIWLLPEGIENFAGDLTEEEKQVVWATANPPAATLFDQKPKGTAWRNKPSWYIVAKNDHAVHPDLERFAAKRMGATTTELASSHVPMLSQPEAVLDVIRAAAEGS
ncbi:MAG: alpha/beta hydrolase [Acidimicrobiales bacterium]|jgi:pimeloyl-ACP methyl ester carboxylesterase